MVEANVKDLSMLKQIFSNQANIISSTGLKHKITIIFASGKILFCKPNSLNVIQSMSNSDIK